MLHIISFVQILSFNKHTDMIFIYKKAIQRQCYEYTRDNPINILVCRLYFMK